MLKPLVIAGAGGFGREVAWLVEDINRSSPTWDFLGFLDDRYPTETPEGFKVLGPLSAADRFSDRALTVCAIGDPVARRELVDKLRSSGFKFATLIHPSVAMSSFVTVGPGSVICAGTSITTNVKIGEHCILSPGCRIGHDTIIEDYASLMPGVNIAGEVKIGAGAYFGLNAAVINQVTVGEWTILGAGAVAVNDIPPNVVAVGVPASPIKQRAI